MPTTPDTPELVSVHTVLSKLKVIGLWLVLLTDNQFQSSLKPTLEYSNHTEVELLASMLVAEPIWITPFSWLVMMPTLGSSRTLGELAGVKADTSDSKELETELELAVSNYQKSLPSNEQFRKKF